jgi:ribokinase
MRMDADGQVLVFGAAHADMVLTVADLPRPGETVIALSLDMGFGGKGANQAVAAAATARVRFAGSVGVDDAGDAVIGNLRARGVRTDGVVTRASHPTGTAVVVVDDRGRNQIVVASGAAAIWDSDDIERSLEGIAQGDVVLLQCEVPGGVVARTLHAAAGTPATVVLNLAPFIELPPDAVACADLVIVNESEARSLLGEDLSGGTRELAQRVAASLGSACIVTLGEAGSMHSTADGAVTEVPAYKVADVVDTTGAGDVYAGTLAATLANGRSLQEAMVAASRAAGISVLSPGAQPRLTTPAGID